MIDKIKDRVNRRLKFWYLHLIAGLLTLLIGVWVIRTPAVSLLGLTLYISIGFIFSGLSDIINSIANRKQLKGWGWYLFGGGLFLILGLHLAMRPLLTVAILNLYVGIWMLFRSVLHIGTSWQMKKEGSKNWIWVLAFAIIGVIISLLLLWNPAIIAIAISYLMGLGIMLLGVIQISMAFMRRRIKKGLNEVYDKLNISDVNPDDFNPSDFTEYEIIEDK